MENNGKIISKETLELRRAGKNIKKGTEDLAKYVKEVANPRLERDRRALKKAVAEYPEKKRKYDRMIMRQYKKDDLAIRKAFRAAGKIVPFLSKALGAIGVLAPTVAGSSELKDIKKKKFGGIAIQGVKEPNKIHRS